MTGPEVTGREVTGTGSITLLPVAGLPEVQPGHDLAVLIAAVTELRDGDVVVVAQKVVSKAEGALVALDPAEELEAARRRVAREQAVRVVADSAAALVVQTRHGLVCANAGVDASNVPDGWLSLLPVDPDASARRLRDGLLRRTGKTVAVIVADTFGRPWRLGQTDVAIGVAGIGALRDERAGTDRHGRRLEVTQVAIADELAAAADLVRRKADGVPVVVVRGLRYHRDGTASARALQRPAPEDLFRFGRGGLAAALSTRPGRLDGEPVPAADLARALACLNRVPGVRARASTSARGTAVALRGDAADAGVGAGLLPGVAADLLPGVAAGLLLAAFTDLGYPARQRRPLEQEDADIVVETCAPGREQAPDHAR